MIAAALALALVGEPVFATELEARQWRAIVLLEGDLATATTALAACGRKLNRCQQAPLELPPPEPMPEPDSGRLVVEIDAGSVALVVAIVVAVAGAAFGLGVAAGAP